MHKSVPTALPFQENTGHGIIQEASGAIITASIARSQLSAAWLKRTNWRRKSFPWIAGRPVAAGTLAGSPRMVRQQLAALEEAGIQEVIVAFPDALNLDTLRLFARECITPLTIPGR